MVRGGSRCIEHGHLLGAVAEGRVSVECVSISRSRHDYLFVNGKVGWVELRERWCPLGVDPAHSRSELADGIDGVLHESQGSLELALDAVGDTD